MPRTSNQSVIAWITTSAVPAAQCPPAARISRIVRSWSTVGVLPVSFDLECPECAGKTDAVVGHAGLTQACHVRLERPNPLGTEFFQELVHVLFLVAFRGSHDRHTLFGLFSQSITPHQPQSGLFVFGHSPEAMLSSITSTLLLILDHVALKSERSWTVPIRFSFSHA